MEVISAAPRQSEVGSRQIQDRFTYRQGNSRSETPDHQPGSQDTEDKQIKQYTEEIEEQPEQPQSLKLNFKGLLQKARNKFGRVTKIQ